MKSAMGSSKYEFEPEKFKEELKDIMYKSYKYPSGGKLSYGWKKQLIVEVVREFIEG